MAKKIFNVLFCLLGLLAVSVVSLVFISLSSFETGMVFWHIIYLCVMGFTYSLRWGDKRFWGNEWLMVAGFALPALISYIVDTATRSGFLQYALTWLIFIYYSIPFTLLSAVIAIVIYISGAAKREKKWC